MSQGILSPGEVSLGQYITVLAWTPLESVHGGLFTEVQVLTRQDRSYCGSVLIVKAVQLPYVGVQEICQLSKKPKDWVIRLDTRQCTLMELSPEYVETFTGIKATQ